MAPYETGPASTTSSGRGASSGGYYQNLVRGLGIDSVLLDPRVTVPLDLRARAGELLERHGCGSAAIMLASRRAQRTVTRNAGHPIGSPSSSRCCSKSSTTGVCSLGPLATATPAMRWNPGSSRQHGRSFLEPCAADVSPGEPHRPDRRGAADGCPYFCRAVVSNDSGAMHLAAALGLPVTAVFGPTDERATGPLGHHQILTNPVWCRPCMLRECPIDHRCLTRISTRRVFEAVSQQVQGSVPSRWPGDLCLLPSIYPLPGDDALARRFTRLIDAFSGRRVVRGG